MTSNSDKPESKPASKPDSKPAPKDDKDALKSLPMPELMKKLGASADGLTQAGVQKRLTQYGPNAIEEKKTNIILKFLSYFWGPIPWMIEGAVILSGVVQHWMDFGIILFLLFSNAMVGFWEEHQAGNAIDALKKRLAVNARAKRDGKWTTPKASELVPGDVIRLRLGDIIPADARLLEGDSVQVDQSALTGESLPVEVKPGGAVYSGSIVRQGEIDAMVYATGTNTYFGKTAQLVQSADTVSHFQRSVLKIGNYLIALAVAMVLLIVIVALFRHDPVLTTLEFCLVLLVAAIPVAMPTVLSVTMAVGARLLSKKEVVVTKLSAIEELAGVDILCSDKTGTLTQNKLSLGDPFTCGKQPQLQWLNMDEALEHCSRGASTWKFATNDDGGEPDVVLACAGDVPTIEICAASWLLQKHVPGIKVRVVNVVDLMTLMFPDKHSHGMDEMSFNALFTESAPVIFAFHNNRWLIHTLVHGRSNEGRFHVHGYMDRGTTTTPFDMVVLNEMSRFHLALDALKHIPRLRLQAEHAINFFNQELRHHHDYIREHLEDMPEIRNWQWTKDFSESTAPAPLAKGHPQKATFTDS